MRPRWWLHCAAAIWVARRSMSSSKRLKSGAMFADCPNLILTPHIAGVSLESNERVSDLIARKVLEVLA